MEKPKKKPRCRVAVLFLLIFATAAGASSGLTATTAVGAHSQNGTATTATASASPPPALGCEERYARAVFELRRMRMRACLDTLDALLRRCHDHDGTTAAATAATTTTTKPNAHQSMRAKASFLRAKVLLLDGDWDAAEAAAAAALAWSAQQQRLADAGSALGGEHHARALKAAEALLLRVALQRKAHAAAAAHVASGHYEPVGLSLTPGCQLGYMDIPAAVNWCLDLQNNVVKSANPTSRRSGQPRAR
jgi:hypothetical protein